MKYALISLLLLSTSLANAQSKILENQVLNSKILPYEVNYSIYLPPDYDQSQREYPIVYLLHGYTDDDSGWVQFGEVKRLVDAGIASGDIPPMVIAMPDGKVTWYLNDIGGTERWEDMFVQEFIPEIENKYRIRKKKEFRGISGLSMGGFGSLRLSMAYPDLFAACAAYSSAVWTAEEFKNMNGNAYEQRFGKIFGSGLKGDARINDHWKANSVLDMVRTRNLDELKRVRYYFDCGDDDFLAIGNSTLHIEMTKRGLPHQYRVRDGSHSWSFWRTSLPIGLKFIGESFRR